MSRAVQTLVLQEPGRLVLRESSFPPEPKPGEALVKVRRVGVCGTDLHAFQGNQPFFDYPRILGHELGVEIVAIGENARDLAPGDRCAVEPYFNCGLCNACRRGKTNCCEQLKVLGVHVDGGMREYLVLPAHKLHKSSTLTLNQLALVEMLCIGAHAVSRADLSRDDGVLIVGAGPIGLSVAMFARLAGARVIILERSARRITFCTERLGFGDTLLANETVPDRVREMLGGKLPEAVFDATGNRQSMEQSFFYVGHGGKLILVGLFQGHLSFHDPDLHRREMTILSSRNALPSDFESVMRVLEHGLIDPLPWISATVPLADARDEFRRWAEPEHGTIKAMLTL